MKAAPDGAVASAPAAEAAPVPGLKRSLGLFDVIQTASIAAIAVAFAAYAGHILALPPWGIQLLAVGAIAFLTPLNALGVREGVVVQNLLTSIKVAVMIGLILLAFLSPAAEFPPVSGMGSTGGPAAVTWPLFAAALIGPLFAFDGWITSSYLAGELKRPARTLPWAALGSVGLVAVLYLALNGAYLEVLGPQGVAASSLVTADTARSLLDRAGPTWLTCVVFASWLFYALGGAAVFVLRRRRDRKLPYRVWGYPLVPGSFVIAAGALLVGAVIPDPAYAGLGALLLLSGVPAYRVFRRR